MSKFIIFILGIAVMSGCATLKTDEINLNEAIVIANQKTASMQVDLKKMHIICDENNSFWNKFTRDVHFFEMNPKMKRVFENRNYYSIDFMPNQIGALDGDLNVFIDRKTGKVFITMQGVHVKYW